MVCKHQLNSLGVVMASVLLNDTPFDLSFHVASSSLTQYDTILV